MKLKTYTFKTLTALCIGLALISCSKVEPDNGGNGNSGNNGNTTPVEEPSPFNNSNTFGTITDAETGEGIANVPVTDGYTFTTTNSKGEYGMNRNPKARKVYYTTPEGYEINLDPGNRRPTFFSDGILESTGRVRKDFKLTKLKAEEKHLTIIAVGDPQCAKASTVSRFKDETIADLKKTISSLPDNNVYAVTLGDIIYDSNDMWDSCAGAMASLSVSGRQVPFFQCIGNHDHDGTVNEAEGDYGATLRFVKMYGPTDYSFDRKGVHVVVMDDIKVKSIESTSNSNKLKWGSYDRRIEDEQENWLKEDLSHVSNPAGKTLILCMHAPMFEISSTRSARIMKMMTQFKEAHIFTGHTHCNENSIYPEYVCRGGQPVYEHTHATACGMWWQSNSDSSGCPAGYSVYSFTDGTLDDWYIKGSHTPANLQIRAYDGSEIYPARLGKMLKYDWYTPIQALTDSYDLYGFAELQGCLIADVFNSDDKNWKVELYVNGAKAGDFKRLPDGKISNICYASWAYENNHKNSNVNKKLYNRLWYIKQDNAVADMKNWEIVATQTIPGSGKKHTFKCSSLTGADNWDF